MFLHGLALVNHHWLRLINIFSEKRRQKLLRNYGIVELLIYALQIPFARYYKTPPKTVTASCHNQ